MEKTIEEVVSVHPFVLVDFYATWCEPCKWVVPVLENVQLHFKEKLSVQKIDVDEHAESARELKIMSVPTLVLFHNGKEVWRIRGFDTAPKLIRIFEEIIK